MLKRRAPAACAHLTLVDSETESDELHTNIRVRDRVDGTSKKNGEAGPSMNQVEEGESSKKNDKEKGYVPSFQLAQVPVQG